MSEQRKIQHDKALAKETSETRNAWPDSADDTAQEDTRHNIGDIDKIFKYLQISLAVLGIYNYTKKNNLSSVKHLLFYSKAALYNLFVLLLMWSFFVKKVVDWFYVEVEHGYTMLKVIPIAWALQVATNGLILLKLSHPRFGNIPKANEIWRRKVLPLVEELKLDAKPRNIKRHLLLVIILGWVCVAFNALVFTFFLVYQYTSFSTLMTELIISPLPINLGTRLIMSITMVFMSAAQIMAMVYVIVVCIIMKYCFKLSSQALETTNNNWMEPDKYPHCLRRQRLLHLYTCLAVEQFDKDVKYFFANIFFTSVPMSILFLYQIFKTEMDSLLMVVHVFQLAFGLVIVMTICAYAASMNKAAHAPLRRLHQTGMTGISLEQLAQVNLYLSQLTSGPIGFSILDFCVITKELVLTVGGIFLTYSFVLLQF